MINFNNHDITAITYDDHSIQKIYGCDGNLVWQYVPPAPPLYRWVTYDHVMPPYDPHGGGFYPIYGIRFSASDFIAVEDPLIETVGSDEDFEATFLGFSKDGNSVVGKNSGGDVVLEWAIGQTVEFIWLTLEEQGYPLPALMDCVITATEDVLTSMTYQLLEMVDGQWVHYNASQDIPYASERYLGIKMAEDEVPQNFSDKISFRDKEYPTESWAEFGVETSDPTSALYGVYGCDVGGTPAVLPLVDGYYEQYFSKPMYISLTERAPSFIAPFDCHLLKDNQ